MTRLFVAIVPPDDVKAAVVEARGTLDGARFVRAEQMHLTLKFIEDHPAERLNDLVARFETIVHPPFDLELGSWGRFGHPPRVVWVDVTPHVPVRRLAGLVEDAFENEGIARDDRDFTPHLTVARLKRTSPAKVRHYLDDRADFAAPPWPVRAVRLYESKLGPKGARHTVLSEVPLRPEP